jgi:hypothetical protein
MNSQINVRKKDLNVFAGLKSGGLSEKLLKKCASDSSLVDRDYASAGEDPTTVIKAESAEGKNVRIYFSSLSY